MRLINYEEFKRLLLEERGKIPLTVPCATYELGKEKPNINGQFIKHGIKIAFRCLERCQNIATDSSTIQQPEWISCSERLPTDEKTVLVYYGFDHGDGIGGMRYISTLRFFCFDKRPHWQHEDISGMTVTHWMPLPEPPKEE